MDESRARICPDLWSLRAQLSAEYAIPHLTLKSAVGLTNQPKVDLAATTGYKDIVVGGEATYDSAKGQVTKWAAGVGARFHTETAVYPQRSSPAHPSSVRELE